MLVVLGFGFFVFFQKPRKPLYYVWLFFCLSMAIYQLSFIIGVNTAATAKIAYWIWYTNIAEDILIGLFTLHIFILATDGLKKFKNLLKFMYGFGALIVGASIFFPSAFIVDVVPKSYLLSYVNTTGPLYYVIDGYFLLCFLLSYYVLFFERARHGTEGKKRIDYYIAGLSFGFLMGVTAFAPDFNLPIDPGISALLGLFVVPLVYGMIKKGLMDIRIVIRRVVVVTVLVTFVAVIFVMISFLSSWLTVHMPSFGFWLMPLLAAFVLVIVGFLYYKKEKETEQLMYEFITVVAHKFRTPLTRIRWQTEDLTDQLNLSPKTIEGVAQINRSALELIHLSNLLISAGNMEQEKYRYSYSNVDLPAVVEKVLVSFKDHLALKNINLSTETGINLPPVYVDEDKLVSAIYVLVENAIAYTGKNGTIRIQISAEKDTVRFSILDSGMGISEKDQSRIFGRFYRGESARHADTEGVGLGLYIAKSIVERQGGSIGVISSGEGKGSTFWFTLPAQTRTAQKT
jgi:signal transduction histidine kinase